MQLQLVDGLLRSGGREGGGRDDTDAAWKKNLEKPGRLEEKLQGSPRCTTVTAAQQLDRLALGAVCVKAARIQTPAAQT